MAATLEIYYNDSHCAANMSKLVVLTGGWCDSDTHTVPFELCGLWNCVGENHAYARILLFTTPKLFFV